MKTYSIIVLVYYTVLLASGAQLSKRINESLTIQYPREDTSICDWYHNDQLVPSQWVQDNGDLMLPANDWSVYGVIISQCGSVNYTNVVINPGVYRILLFVCSKNVLLFHSSVSNCETF